MRPPHTSSFRTSRILTHIPLSAGTHISKHNLYIHDSTQLSDPSSIFACTTRASSSLTFLFFPLTMPQPLNSKDGAQFRQLVKLYEAKQHKKAIKTADGILKKNANHGDTMAMKALTLNSMGQTEEGMLDQSIPPVHSKAWNHI